MYLTLTLNPSIDYYIDLPSGKALVTGSPEAPAVNRSIKERFEAGGKGINVAKILRRLSDGKSEVIAAGFSAGFTGDEIVSNISKEGITPRFINVPGNSRINVKTRDGNGIETEINGTGPAIGPGDINRLIKSLEQTEFDTLFLSGSLPGTLNPDTYSVIIKAVLDIRPAARIIADCEGETLLKCLSLKPYLIKPNAHELASVTGMKIDTSSPLSEIKRAACRLINNGAQNVLVSLGGNGACLITNTGMTYSCPGIKGDVISTIGAGDTMIASFIYGIDYGLPMETALSLANACAAASAFSEGLADSDSLRKILKEYA